MLSDEARQEILAQLTQGKTPPFEHLNWGFRESKIDTSVGVVVEDLCIVFGELPFSEYLEFLRELVHSKEYGLKWEGGPDYWTIRPSHQGKAHGPPILAHRISAPSSWERQLEKYRLMQMNSLWLLGATFVLILADPSYSDNFLGVAFSHGDDELVTLTINECISISELLGNPTPDFESLKIVKESGAARI